MTDLLTPIQAALALPHAPLPQTQDGALPSTFAVTDLAAASIGAALAADRTLGGLCDWVEAEAPRPVDLPIEGAASLKAAVIPVILHYSAADPLA